MAVSPSIELGMDQLEGTYPLSFGQERLWFLSRLAPAGLAYNRPWALRLRGRLDRRALERSLAAIIRRHQPLRTTVQVEDGVPHGQIHPLAGLQLPPVGVGADDAGEAGWRSAADRAIRRPFDLEREPPFRPELLRLTPDDHVLLLTTHHIGFDAWSQSVLASELGELYAAACQGDDGQLPPLPRQYGDYARWQRALAAGQALRSDLDYWASQFGAGLDAARLSADTLALERRLDGAGEVTRTLGAALSSNLQKLCRAHRVTPFMAFAAALSLLLGRLEGAPAVAIGYPVAGRTEVGFEPLIGLFVNTLPLKMEIPAGSNFATLLEGARAKSLAGADHQRAPFERIVDRLQPPRSLDASPFFNVLLNFRNQPASAPSLAGLEVTELELPEPEARYDLSLHVVPGTGGYRLRALFPRGRQSSERIEALLDQLALELEQVCHEPTSSVRGVSLVPPAHEARLPDLAAQLPKPVHPSVLDMFLEQAQRRPRAEALLDADGPIGYGRLAGLARQEAAAFQAAGLRPGDVVALAGAPCVGRVAGMLAAFLCGAVAQPLDARRTPADQRAELDEAGARLIAHYRSDSGAAAATPSAGVPVLPRPARPATGADPGIEFRPPGSLPDAATIFFTSGTTGRPKGILGGHQSLSHVIRWQRETFSIGPGDRSCMINNLAFDISLRDAFASLCSGAAVCLPDQKSDLDPGAVVAWMAGAGVTFVHLVPSIASYWLAVDGGRSRLPRLRMCTFAGEPLTHTEVAAWRRLADDGLEVVNLYGPTETTLIKTWYRVPANPIAGVQPLGEPLPSCQVLVMAEDGSQCGYGEPGELVIRTPFRSEGYLGGEGLKGKGFTANLAGSDPADLLYRTGDLGRRRTDGCLEYLGRLDRQIKVHGMRMDLAAIESIVRADPAVAECAVDWRTDPSASAEGMLIAYVVPAAGSLDREALRAWLRPRLAGEQLPSRWVRIDRLPLTSSGKLDRSGLPEPSSASEVSVGAIGPESELERRLQRIWRRALNVGDVGVTDDFFELGGHSLLALRLFAMIERELGREMPVSALFEAPTIRQLARRIEGAQAAHSGSGVVPVQTGGGRPPVFWVHAAGGHVLSYRELARRLGPDQPFYAIQGDPPPGPGGFRTVEQLADSYVAAIRAVQPAGPYYLGGLSFGGLVAWEMAQRLADAGEAIAFLGLLDTRRPTLGEDGRRPDVAFELQERVEFHRGQLALRPSSAWPGYLLERVRLMAARSMADLLGHWEPAWAERLSPTGWHVQLSLREADWARRRYQVRAFQGRLTLFRAERQPGWSRSPHLGWQGFAEGGLEIVLVPGTHASIISGPNLRILASALGDRLRGAQGRAAADVGQGA